MGTGLPYMELVGGRNTKRGWVSAAHLGCTPHLISASPLQPGVPSVLEQGPERSSCTAGRAQMVRTPLYPQTSPHPAHVSPSLHPDSKPSANSHLLPPSCCTGCK